MLEVEISKGVNKLDNLLKPMRCRNCPLDGFCDELMDDSTLDLCEVLEKAKEYLGGE